MKLTAEFKFTFPTLQLFLAVLCFLTAPLFSSFDPLPVGGRAAGMGEAYSAVVDDVYALHYNPAGLMQIHRPEIGSYYSQLYPGLSDNSQISRSFFGYAQPLGRDGRFGGIGAQYLTMDLPGLYKEETMGVSWAQEYRQRWNVGASLKMLRKQIGSDAYTSNAIDPETGEAKGTPDPLLAKGRTASALGLDLGFQYRLNRAYAVGVAARNVNNPDVGLSGSTDKAPSILTAALARRLRAGSLDVELMSWKSSENNIRLNLGGEHWFKERFALRAGAAFGSRSYTSASFGASLKFESFQFDYATVLPLQGVDGTLGIQQLSMTIRLGKPPVDPIEQQLIKEKESRIRAETEARYAKAETDRLKKQLYALTEAKTQAEKEAERRAAQRALDEAQNQENDAQAQRNQRSQSSQRTLFNSYTTVLADYNTKVRQGISLLEKRRILEKIITDFTGRGVDLGTVTRELQSLKGEEVKAQKDFELSMSFYRRLVQQGSPIEERRSNLERIVQKYKGTGVNTSTAEQELNSLK